MPVSNTKSWKGKFKYDPILYQKDRDYREQIEYTKLLIGR